VRGLELGAQYQVNASWRANLGYAYNDARFRTFIADGNDFSGQAFLFAPRSMWLLGARYQTGAVTLHADLVWRKGSPSEYQFDGAGRVSGVRTGDDHSIVNLSAEYRLNPRTTVSAYVKNLLDERYVLNNRSGSTVDVGAPRRLGVALRYEL
jgi:outer membrane receptor protein involved in Fe transport